VPGPEDGTVTLIRTATSTAGPTITRGKDRRPYRYPAGGNSRDGHQPATARDPDPTATKPPGRPSRSGSADCHRHHLTSHRLHGKQMGLWSTDGPALRAVLLASHDHLHIKQMRIFAG
jgi:hypothetical protein